MAIRPLYDFQRPAFRYTGKVQHPALFMEMRLGKTLVTLRRLIAEDLFPALIVAPYGALWSWMEEAKKESFPETDSCMLAGLRSERLNLLDRLTSSLYLVNKEGAFVIPEIAGKPWKAIICDESTFLKTPPRDNTSKRFGRRPSISKFFCENFRDVPRRFILTGTPAPEGPLDLFQQLAFLDPRILGCKNYWEFRHKWFQAGEFHQYSMTGEGSLFLQSRLGQYCFSLTRKDVGKDVRKIFSRRMISLPANARKIYDRAKKEFVFAAFDDPDKIVSTTIFKLPSFIWMRRIAGGFDEDGNMFHDGKINEVKSLLTGELKNEQVVIWAQFIPEVKAIHESLEKVGIESTIIHGGISLDERPQRIFRFRNGLCQCLVGIPDAFKYGLDFSNASTVIYYSSPLGLETRNQSEDRAVSISKGSAVLYIDLHAEHTVDEDIYDGLKDKGDLQTIIRGWMNGNWK